MWVQHYLDCEDVYLTGLRVRSRVNHNNDGIDIDCCRRVRISDCDVWSGDDAIVLKSTSDKPCRDIVISNCVISSNCSALKLGTESNGGFEDVAVSNCSIYDTRLAGIAVEMVDGGILDRVRFSNINMRNVRGPIFVRLGNRARPFIEGGSTPGMGKLRNVLIEGVSATGGAKIGCAICGLPGHPVEHITLRDISVSFEGGGTREDAAREIPELPDKYPEFPMFGVLPAYGFYVRHARDVHFDNVRCTTATPDARPALVTEDIEEFDVERFRPAEGVVRRPQR
jgi:polygalacturonase